MIIIPAIDIKNGRCVRLIQGRMDQETVFSDDPAAMAKRWVENGAKLIHVVDLDGAVQKQPQNIKSIQRIVDSVNVEAFPGRIIVGIDARDVLVAIEGWTKTTRVKAVDLAKQFEDCGVTAINFTDIHRDGMQTGPNIEETRRLAQAISIPVVASGGVSTIDDIKNLMPLETVGVIGVITGKALYTGSLKLKEAIEVARN